MNQLYLSIYEGVKGVKGFFSTREGASLESPYYNREVLQAVGAEHLQIIWPKQTHSDHIAVIREKGTEPLKIPDTDGMITNVPGVLLTTVHADCLAVYLYDPVKQAIGLVHAGWRGTLAGIGRKAAFMMVQEYGCSPRDLQVHISPGISRCCFETGPEVYQAFKETWDFTHFFAKPEGEKYFIDLKAINQRQLEDMGIEQIVINNHCTCCEPELFRSYRREGGMKARMGAGLWLTDEK